MAKSAIESHARANFEAQEKAWRKMAEFLEVNETAGFLEVRKADREDQPRSATDSVTWWPRFFRSVAGSY